MTVKPALRVPAASKRVVLPLWAALVVAGASGPVLDAAFPDRDVWFLAFPGIALVLLALRGRSLGGALLTGLVAGASFFFLHIEWASLFLGPLPMSALATVMALFGAAGGAVIALAYRWVPRVWPGVLGRLVLLPAVVAGLWTAREAWSAVWPYGGFAWGRVAQSQSESPLAPLFAYLGISGLGFLMVLLTAAALEVATVLTREYALRPVAGIRSSRIAYSRGLVGVLATACLVLLVPGWPVVQDGTLRLAAVQGNGKAGYFDQRERGDLLRAQLAATERIIDEEIDLVIWPEGGSDLSPLTEPAAAAAFDYVTEAMDAPLLAGVITQREQATYNSQLLWLPGEGLVDLYDKRHPVPFGEYIPDRAFWRMFAPELIDMVARDYSPGTTDMVVEVGGVTVGVNICFDIVDDQILTESVEQGARLIVASSNNADFGRTDESAQQLAFARIRAIELGRTVVNISTVGISAVINADGSTLAELPWYTADSMIIDAPLSSTITPAVLLGRELEWFATGLGLAGLVLGAAAGRSSRD